MNHIYIRMSLLSHTWGDWEDFRNPSRCPHYRGSIVPQKAKIMYTCLFPDLTTWRICGPRNRLVSFLGLSLLPPPFDDYHISSNSRCPRRVATASIHSTCTRRWMTITRLALGLFCVVRHVSIAESRTERLCVLLTASNSHQCITSTYHHWWLLVFQRNKHCPRIVAIFK